MGHTKQIARSTQCWRVLPAAMGLGAIVVLGRAGTAAEEPGTTQPAAAQPATTQPVVADASDGAGRPDHERLHGRGMRGPGGGGPGYRRFPVPQQDADQSNEASQFMADHAPRYWAWVTSGNVNDDQRKNILSAVNTAYASYQRLKPDDPVLFSTIVKRVEVEDNLFGLRAEASQVTDANRNAFAAKVRAQLNLSTDLIFQERQLRLARLKRTIEKEQKLLDEDSARRADMVNERLNRILRGYGGGGMPFPGMRGGVGGGGGGGEQSDSH